MLKSLFLSICLPLISYIIQTNEASNDRGFGEDLVDKLLRSLGCRERPRTISKLWEIIGQVAQKFGHVDTVFAAVAPVYIRGYIEWTEAKLLTEHFNVSLNEMATAVGLSIQDLNKEAQKIIDKATKDGDFFLKDNIKDKCSIHYIRWRYILAKGNNTDIKTLKEYMKHCGIDNDVTFATEMAYLWTRTSIFGAHTPAESSRITLDIILEGLTIYKMALPNTVSAVEALFRLLTNNPKISSNPTATTT